MSKLVQLTRGDGQNIYPSELVDRSLDISFTLKPREITVLPYKFVFVLVNEDPRTGNGTIALKVRNLVKQERERVIKDIEGQGPPTALAPPPPRVLVKSWEAITIEDAPDRTRVYPLLFPTVRVSANLSSRFC